MPYEYVFPSHKTGGQGGDDGGDGRVNMQMHCLDEEHEPVLPPPQT